MGLFRRIENGTTTVGDSSKLKLILFILFIVSFLGGIIISNL